MTLQNWPNGAQVAVTLTVAFEKWSTSRVEPTMKPGTSVLSEELIAQGAVDLASKSWFDYTHQAGLPRALRILAEAGVTATFPTSGIAVQDHPDIVKRIAAEGHEVAGHGWAQDIRAPYLTPEQEKAGIERCVDVITRVTGSRPTGWISTAAQPSEQTARLLAECGFRWHADAEDSDAPYVISAAGTRMAVIPYQHEVNDLAWVRYKTMPWDWARLFTETLQWLVERDGPGLKTMNASIHAPIYARPFGAKAFADVIDFAKSLGDRVWIASRHDIAEHVLTAGG